MPDSGKTMSLKQMISKFVPNHSLVYLEGILANRLPMAAVHEIIRAKKRNLRLVSGPNGLAIDQLVGSGCVEEVEFYFLGHITEQGFATMRRFRVASETGTIKVKESMGYTICMALRAGAYGIPFIPVPDFRGSDLLKVRKDYRVMASPYDSDKTVILVPALNPDVLILHAHTADTKGNVVLDEPWPIFTLTIAQACNHVLVTVEEIVEAGTLNPSRITVPHFLVDAIAHVPFGAAPTALNKKYETSFSHIGLYQKAAKTAEGFAQYLGEYVTGTANHKEFLVKAGPPPMWNPRLGQKANYDTKSNRRRITKDQSADFSFDELILAAIAHQINDGELVFTGVASPVQMMATLLARESHAPNLLYFNLLGTINPHPSQLPISTGDPHLFDSCENAITFPEIFDLANRGQMDVVFLGGVQIDKFGNLNMSIIGDDYTHPKVRLPGGAGGPLMIRTFRRVVSWRSNHSKQCLVDKVSFITSPGWISSAKGIRHGGPDIIVTDLCIFRFNRKSKDVWLESIHPGVNLETVKNQTGFSFKVPTNVPFTSPPTNQECTIIRSIIDPEGIRKQLIRQPKI
jgi:acyl CoA:acetate/3-ketoacid CoA transferase alpha subunit/acyl CoA:acetate/3-ketoacid CoA transferase beta subunit